MIWYLLYPLRGTTEAPVLSPAHPLRIVLTRYGRYAAQHVVTTLLISVAVAATLLYPIPFLYTNDFINGASNLPHHVWTAAQPLPYDTEVEPDVFMRSIWLHGSYMQALDINLLTSALDVQDVLLGVTEDFDPVGTTNSDISEADEEVDLSISQRDSIHVTNGLTPQSWFFHSPLQYWSCSRERLLHDDDILTTVNKQKNLSTSAGVTLRHSIVFSGKRFEERRLLAADALVITLLHLRDSPVGRQWDRKARELQAKFGDTWDIYQTDSQTTHGQLYEFQFRPISIQDSISLALAYGLTIGYFFISLSKLRAVKSKVGLMVTVVSQVTSSVMSSFTICAVFNMDLSRIPRAAYPLAILSMSLENVFRLINAVILTPAEDNTSSRIGHAWGETAPIAIASTVQNVVILLGLSRLVSPGVSAFCVFAAIAITFDCFYLSTFFLSVLSVDVRRLELSDALDKAASNHTQASNATSRERISIVDRVLQGKMALSTRIAGTIVTIGFVLIAQWHFFDDELFFLTFWRFWKGHEASAYQSQGKRSSLQDLHQVRSPTSWLRMQDHETAKEVINIIRPSAYSYVARVYDPLVLVLKNSDRTPRGTQLTFLPAAYDFINHEMSRFVVIIIVVIAAVRLLTSFLLLDEEEHNALQARNEAESGSILSVRSLAGGHALDIAMLCQSSDGHLVSVGLDRLIRVWNIRNNQNYVVVDGRQGKRDVFPVLAIEIDESCDWLVIVSKSRVNFWNLRDRTWAAPVEIESRSRRSETILLASRGRNEVPEVVIVWRDGSVTDTTRAADGDTIDFMMCTSTLASAEGYIGDSSDPMSANVTIMTLTKDGQVLRASRREQVWSTQTFATVVDEDQRSFHQLSIWASLHLVLVASSTRVYLLSIKDGRQLCEICTESMTPRSLRSVLLGSRTPIAASAALVSLVVCYTSRTSGECVIQTYMPLEGAETISLDAHDEGEEDLGGHAQKTKKSVKAAGAWELLTSGTVIGVRRRMAEHDPRDSNGHDEAIGLRHRFPSKSNGVRSRMQDYWEMWTASSITKGDADEARPLIKANEGPGQLIVPGIGPRAVVGLTSVAFGFGNVIKMVTIGGQQRFDTPKYGNLGDPWQSTSRRRKSGGIGRVNSGI